MTPSVVIPPAPQTPVRPPTPPPTTPTPASSESDSSTEDQGESETSFSTVTISPPNKPSAAYPLHGECEKERNEEEAKEEEEKDTKEEEEQQDQVEEKEKEGEEKEDREREQGEGEEDDGRRGGRRISLTMWEGTSGSPQMTSALNQPWMSCTRSASYVSSDETESDDDMWEELHQLQLRWVESLGEVGGV